MNVIKLTAVEQKTALKRTQIYQKIAAGEFPKQIRLGPKAVGWLESEINSWIAARVAERDGAVRR